ELGYERIEVLIASRVRFVKLLLHASLIHRLLGLLSKPLTICRLVIEDCDDLALVLLGEECTGHRALLVVTAADAECVPQASIREGHARRSRGDLDDAGLGVRVRGWNR